MPSRRRDRSSRITEDEINGLILKLHALMLPGSSSRVSTSNILKETCNYLKKLQKEVDELSERLSQLLPSRTVDAEAIWTLLQHL